MSTKTIEQLQQIVEDESRSNEDRKQAAEHILALQANTTGEPAPAAEGVLWRLYVQDHLGTIMDEQRSLADRVLVARSVLGRYQRETYQPSYQATDEDRKLIADVVGRIKSATQPDGTVYYSIPGSVWV